MGRFLFSLLMVETILGTGCVSQAAPFLTAYDYILSAVVKNDADALSSLIKRGMNINAQNRSGYTALCTMVAQNNADGYQMLISHGASSQVACMRDIPVERVSQFYADNPQFGVYYRGRVYSQPVAPQEESSSLLSGIPWPHVGEILLGGAAVGLAAAIGTGGHGSSDNPPEEKNKYEAVDTGKTPEYYTKETSEWNAEYNGGSWVNLSGDPVAHATFLPDINAASAYARGYTGYKVERPEDGKPTITDEKIKVAIVDTGMENGLYAHKQLAPNILIDPDGKGTYNYVYGVHSEKNNTNYYDYTPPVDMVGSGTVTQYLNGVAISSVPMLPAEWVAYASKFAKLCTEATEKDCWHYGKQDDNTYTMRYESSISGVAPIDYTGVSEAVFAEYRAKYGKDGYVYDPSDPTPFLLDKSHESHGTAMAGTIGAIQDKTTMSGVAPNASLIPIRTDFDMLSAIGLIPAVLKDHAPQVVNLSLGPSVDGMEPTNPFYSRSFLGNDYRGAGGVTSHNREIWEDSTQLQEAYNAAIKSDAVLVFAAGNDGKPQSSAYVVGQAVSGEYKNIVLDVVSVKKEGTPSTNSSGYLINDYSNRCGAAAGYCIAAPGGVVGKVPADDSLIVSTSFGGYSDDSSSAYAGGAGTSQATAVVSGAVAVLRGAFPFLTAQQSVQILLDTAKYIKPNASEISRYNDDYQTFYDSMYWTGAYRERYGDDYDAYADNTSDGEDVTSKYNAIYGHGLLDLNAATDPVGLPKIVLDDKASSDKTATIADSKINLPIMFKKVLKDMPNHITVLDDYTRPYAFETRNFISSDRRTDTLKRSLHSLMASDEREIHAGDKLSFAFTDAPMDADTTMPGSMHMILKPSENMQIKMGYTSDAQSFGGSYVSRTLSNPFTNMRSAWMTDMSWKLAQNWSFGGGFMMGQNGFLDEDVLERMEHKPMMNMLQSTIAYHPTKNTGFTLAFGQMTEQDSLFGFEGRGAFDTDGNKTDFVSAQVKIMPYQNFSLMGSYTYGITRADKTNSLMNFSRLTSDAFALTATYQPDEKQTYGFKFMSPLRIRSGHVDMNLPVARDAYEDRVYRMTYSSDLKPDAREYDLSMFFMKDVDDSLSLAGEAGVRLNPDHQSDVAPDWRGLLKMNYTW